MLIYIAPSWAFVGLVIGCWLAQWVCYLETARRRRRG